MSLNRLGPRQRCLKSKARRETRSDAAARGWVDVSAVQLASPPQGRPGPKRPASGCGRVCTGLVSIMRPQRWQSLIDVGIGLLA